MRPIFNKKVAENKIYGTVNSARDPHVAENLLKSQTFRIKKKKKRGERQTCVWEARFAPLHSSAITSY